MTIGKWYSVTWATPFVLRFNKRWTAKRRVPKPHTGAEKKWMSGKYSYFASRSTKKIEIEAKRRFARIERIMNKRNVSMSFGLHH
jgi:hypothetical protein